MRRPQRKVLGMAGAGAGGGTSAGVAAAGRGRGAGAGLAALGFGLGRGAGVAGLGFGLAAGMGIDMSMPGMLVCWANAEVPSSRPREVRSKGFIKYRIL